MTKDPLTPRRREAIRQLIPYIHSKDDPWPQVWLIRRLIRGFLRRPYVKRRKK